MACGGLCIAASPLNSKHRRVDFRLAHATIIHQPNTKQTVNSFGYMASCNPHNMVPSMTLHFPHIPYTSICRLLDLSSSSTTGGPNFALVAVPGGDPHHTSARPSGFSPAAVAACSSLGAQQSPTPAGNPVKPPAFVTGNLMPCC